MQTSTGPQVAQSHLEAAGSSCSWTSRPSLAGAGHGCTATLSPAPRAKGGGKQHEGPAEGRTLYQRMAQPMYEGFQRVNRNYASTLLTSGL